MALTEVGLAAMGMLLGSLSLWGLIVTLRRTMTWPTAIGTVVGHNVVPLGKHGRNRKQKVALPVVVFRTADGRPIRMDDGTGTTGGRYRVGAEVLVRYDARDPNKVLIGHHTLVYYGAAVLGCLAFTVFAIIL